MMNIFDPLPHHKVLSIMPTFQCTAECTHCGTGSSPRDRTRLPLAEMLSAIEQAPSSDYKAVVFTGGEATLAWQDLLFGIRKAVSCDLPVRLVTNAYWGVNDHEAERRVAALLDSGLTEINFSTGDEHSRFVPVERVIRAARAAAKAGLPVAIMIEIGSNRRITKETLIERREFKQLLQDYPGACITIVESPWMPLSPTTVQCYDERAVINRSNMAFRRGCDNILSTTTLEADGNMRACCGIAMREIPELRIGNIRETTLVEAEQMASNDFLKRWIRVDGPEYILEWAAHHDPRIDWENMYAHRCQACLRLYKDERVRQVILDHHEEKISDVLFAEWLLFHYPSANVDQPREAMPALMPV